MIKGQKTYEIFALFFQKFEKAKLSGKKFQRTINSCCFPKGLKR